MPMHTPTRLPSAPPHAGSFTPEAAGNTPLGNGAGASHPVQHPSARSDIVVGNGASRKGNESVSPSAETAYWRSTYNREPYYMAGRTFDDYYPAYEMGWRSRAAAGTDNFEQHDDRLAASWNEQRRGSSLTWEQARHAVRAAWERVASRQAGKRVANDDVIDTLNELIETCGDGAQGFAACAEHTNATRLGSLFRQRARSCEDAAVQLRTQVLRLGGKPATGGSTSGALHRGWILVRGAMSGTSDQSMLEECERGELAAIERYRKALERDLPPVVRTMVQYQLNGIVQNHAQIRMLREAETFHA